ncbi:hypothetical protein JG688_00018581, partial [Phytophthora aleatoria]
TYGYVVNKLNDYDDLAYVNVIERREIDAANVTRNVRDAYNGILVTAADYDREDALKTVEEGAADLVAFGRNFIANPNLVERLRAPDVPLESGYTDYPFVTQKE